MAAVVPPGPSEATTAAQPLSSDGQLLWASRVPPRSPRAAVSSSGEQHDRELSLRRTKISLHSSLVPHHAPSILPLPYLCRWSSVPHCVPLIAAQGEAQEVQQVRGPGGCARSGDGHGTNPSLSFPLGPLPEGRGARAEFGLPFKGCGSSVVAPCTNAPLATSQPPGARTLTLSRACTDRGQARQISQKVPQEERGRQRA